MDSEILRKFEETDEKIDDLTKTARANIKSIDMLSILLMGPPPNYDNGVRGDLKKLTRKLDDAIIWGHKIWDVDRRETCIGVKELEKFKEEIKPKLDAIDPSQPAKDVANINLRGVYIVGIMTLLGQIGTILVTILKNGGK